MTVEAFLKQVLHLNQNTDSSDFSILPRIGYYITNISPDTELIIKMGVLRHLGFLVELELRKLR